MNKVFNTAFELSMRILLTLSVVKGEKYTLDLLVIADFMTIYSKEFGIAESNLHGNNKFSFSEYSLRRKLANESIKSLILEHFVDVKQDNEGFHYSLSKKGNSLVNSLESDYANEYLKYSILVHEYMAKKSDCELLRIISNNTIKK